MADKIKETTSDSAVLSPLYQTICGAMQSDGTLPPDFSLPRPEPEGASRSIRFADGAFDGIALYHMAPDKRDIKSLTEVVGLLCAGACDKAAECLHLYFSMDEYISMLPLCDDLQQWILDHKDRIDATLLYNGCLYLLRHSGDIESIKFALCCLELLNTGGDTQVRNLVQVLALSDEFTLFCLFLMRHWPDSSAAIFDAARHVHGWGRIHAVELLEPENDEMRRWLLLEGWQNTVMPEYSALTCAEKSGLAEKLRRAALDAEELSALGKLLPHLLEEGPVAGISALKNADAFLQDYLALAEQHAASFFDDAAVRALRSYAAKQEPANKALLQRCDALLRRAPTQKNDTKQ